MSILSLLFVLMFLLLLALEFKLPRIVVLVINHSPLIYVVVLFLIVGINLCITKLLLFPTYVSRVFDVLEICSKCFIWML